MRLTLATVALLCSTAAFATPTLELEVGAGARGWADSASPALGGRVGVEVLDWFTPGVRALTLSSFGGPERSYALLGDVRVHTAPRLFQVNAGVGVGFAIAHVDGEVSSERVDPYVLGDVGVRLNLWRMWLGFNVGGTPMGPGWLGMLSVGIAPFGRD